MGDTPEVRQFGYRTPRYSFARRMNLEIAQDGGTRVIVVQGVDISSHGVGISVSEQLPIDERVTLILTCGEGETVRIAGRISYHRDDQYGFAFEFCSPEQSQQVQDLISALARPV